MAPINFFSFVASSLARPNFVSSGVSFRSRPWKSMSTYKSTSVKKYAEGTWADALIFQSLCLKQNRIPPCSNYIINLIKRNHHVYETTPPNYPGKLVAGGSVRAMHQHWTNIDVVCRTIGCCGASQSGLQHHNFATWPLVGFNLQVGPHVRERK